MPGVEQIRVKQAIIEGRGRSVSDSGIIRIRHCLRDPRDPRSRPQSHEKGPWVVAREPPGLNHKGQDILHAPDRVVAAVLAETGVLVGFCGIVNRLAGRAIAGVLVGLVHFDEPVPCLCVHSDLLQEGRGPGGQKPNSRSGPRCVLISVALGG